MINAPIGTSTVNPPRYTGVSPSLVLHMIVPSRMGRLLSLEGLGRIRSLSTGETVGKTQRRCHDAYQIPNITIYKGLPGDTCDPFKSGVGKLSHGKGAIMSARRTAPPRPFEEMVIGGLDRGPNRGVVQDLQAAEGLSRRRRDRRLRPSAGMLAIVGGQGMIESVQDARRGVDAREECGTSAGRKASSEARTRARRDSSRGVAPHALGALASRRRAA